MCINYYSIRKTKDDGDYRMSNLAYNNFDEDFDHKYGRQTQKRRPGQMPAKGVDRLRSDHGKESRAHAGNRTMEHRYPSGTSRQSGTRTIQARSAAMPSRTSSVRVSQGTAAVRRGNTYGSQAGRESRFGRIWILVVLGVIVGLLCFLLFRVMKTDASAGVDVSAGIAAITGMEQKDIAEVERVIRQNEEKEAQAIAAQQQEAVEEAKALRYERLNSGEEAITNQFDDVIIMGDSRAEGFVDYGVLNTSSVIAERGATIDEITNNMDKLVNLNPKKIILSYGMNDVIDYSGDAKAFGTKYREILTQLKAALPDTKIYINSVFPVQSVAVSQKPSLQYIGSFNEEFEAICGEMGFTYIDNTNLAQSNSGHYAPDGIHVDRTFYGEWVKVMIVEADL